MVRMQAPPPSEHTLLIRHFCGGTDVSCWWKTVTPREIRVTMVCKTCGEVRASGPVYLVDRSDTALPPERDQ